MNAKKHPSDQMTPLERQKALEEGKVADRVPCIPFMGEFKCRLSGTSVWDFWHDAWKMAETEIIAFNRYGYDRIVIGPNTRGITEASGGTFLYPEQGLPYMGEPFLKDYEQVRQMEPVDALADARIRVFLEEAQILQNQAGKMVMVEMSIGGPFTIASYLRGTEKLLRDCRKCEEEVHALLRVITDSQKSCIDAAASCGVGIAMADPVANPALIGPNMYESFVYPYTKELTDYALEKTGYRVSLHMCGKTYSIWKYLCQYQLNELSLDNLIDMEKAVEELGQHIPVAGNVDPVDVIMNGTREEITEAVHSCIKTGLKSQKGYHLATGCDVPDAAPPEHIDYFMDAARNYDYR